MLDDEEEEVDEEEETGDALAPLTDASPKGTSMRVRLALLIPPIFGGTCL